MKVTNIIRSIKELVGVSIQNESEDSPSRFQCQICETFVPEGRNFCQSCLEKKEVKERWNNPFATDECGWLPVRANAATTTVETPKPKYQLVYHKGVKKYGVQRPDGQVAVHSSQDLAVRAIKGLSDEGWNQVAYGWSSGDGYELVAEPAEVEKPQYQLVSNDKGKYGIQRPDGQVAMFGCREAAVTAIKELDDGSYSPTLFGWFEYVGYKPETPETTKPHKHEVVYSPGTGYEVATAQYILVHHKDGRFGVRYPDGSVAWFGDGLEKAKQVTADLNNGKDEGWMRFSGESWEPYCEKPEVAHPHKYVVVYNADKGQFGVLYPNGQVANFSYFDNAALSARELNAGHEQILRLVLSDGFVPAKFEVVRHANVDKYGIRLSNGIVSPCGNLENATKKAQELSDGVYHVLGLISLEESRNYSPVSAEVEPPKEPFVYKVVYNPLMKRYGVLFPDGLVVDYINFNSAGQVAKELNAGRNGAFNCISGDGFVPVKFEVVCHKDSKLGFGILYPDGKVARFPTFKICSEKAADLNNGIHHNLLFNDYPGYENLLFNDYPGYEPVKYEIVYSTARKQYGVRCPDGQVAYFRVSGICSCYSR